jgi:hypothetical protein
LYWLGLLVNWDANGNLYWSRCWLRRDRSGFGHRRRASASRGWPNRRSEFIVTVKELYFLSGGRTLQPSSGGSSSYHSAGARLLLSLLGLLLSLGCFEGVEGFIIFQFRSRGQSRCLLSSKRSSICFYNFWLCPRVLLFRCFWCFGSLV